jgi:hypothetical protein
MSKRELCLVVDVETAGGFAKPLVYDLGFAVVERSTGRIVEAHSLVVRDVFFDMPEQMATAYYAEKLPEYYKGIRSGAFRVVRFWTAWKMVREIIAKYNIRRVYAYNAKFDKGALNTTARVVTAGKVCNFFPRGVKFCDIWHMACQTVLSQKRYRKFAEANGLVSEAGNLRTSAEACYAYVTGQPGYAEPHTGLEDVIIEAQILHKVLRQHKRVCECLVHNPWRIPQTA